MELEREGGKGKSGAQLEARDASDASIVVAAIAIVMPVAQVVSDVIVEQSSRCHGLYTSFLESWWHAAPAWCVVVCLYMC